MLPPETAAQGAAQPAATQEPDVFLDLLSQKLKIREPERRDKVKETVTDLCRILLKDAVKISPDVNRTISAIIAEIDRKLSEQINLIMHHEDFKALEGTWRGLRHLVYNTETDETLKIRIFNISKNDLRKTLKAFEGVPWDQSPIFKRIYDDEYSTPGGHPYGAIVGDYSFDHSPEDVKMLGNIAQIAATAHAPFIAAAAPSVMGFDTWQELSGPRDLTKKFQTDDYAAWRSLRDSDDSRYLGLTLPRFLSRLPYGAKTTPVEEFAFEEDTEGADHSKYVWSNSAYAMGVNITRAFKMYGWCAKIRGTEDGGVVEGLPLHTFPTDDGGVDSKCPTEIAITMRREAELAKNGFMPLSHYKHTDFASFIGAQSLQKPAVFEDDDATANANLSARLPYLFATCRFAHFLNKMVYDKIGSFKERDDMERWLNKWIGQYCCDSKSAEDVKARYPLAEAKVEVLDVKGNPGYYTSKFWLRPHFQLEGLKVSLRLVAKLPSGKT